MNKVFTAEEFREAYGKHFKSSPGCVDFNERDVPASVKPLIPYARFWGLEDDEETENLLDKIPKSLQQNFRDALDSFDDALDDWLGGPEAQKDEPTAAYVVFSAMRIAAYSISDDDDDDG